MKKDSIVLWTPDEEFIQNSNLKHYEDWLGRTEKLHFTDYASLYQWSVDCVEDFWTSLMDYFDILHDGQIDSALTGDGMPGMQWMDGVSLNYAEHVFRQYDEGRPALIFVNEEERTEISWEELKKKTTAVRSALKAAGVVKGDRVIAYMPNIPETIYCFLAANSLGAIWSCCSPDFGAETVIDRFAQIEAKVFIAVDGYQYNGKPYSKESELSEISAALSSVEQMVLLPYLDDNAHFQGFYGWENWLAQGDATEELRFERVPFNFPIWVLYSSGTTGKPKAITHSHGGVLLEHLKYMSFHNDVKPGENFFWFTTTGWMMWNFLQASLLVGATAVLFDGSPARPDLGRLWRLAAQLPIHHFGTSAPYLIACMRKGMKPGEEVNLSQLRSIGSTGAPLPPEAFEWVYAAVSKKVWLCSMSGGTDVCTAFVGGNPYLPVIKGRIQSRSLGADLVALGEDEKPVYGSLGEMVLRKPMPSMPIFFWNDPDMNRYKASYFEEYEGFWRHGDWIQIYEDGSLIIQGRSDATLNRKGIRIGTAEIYRVLNQMEDIKDTLIINVEQSNGDDVMPLFVVPAEGISVTDALKADINRELREQCTPRHVPDMIIEVADIPYTLSGKKMEVPVKKLFMPVSSSKKVKKDAIKNPEAMTIFEKIAKSGLPEK